MNIGHMVMALGEFNYTEFYDSYSEAYTAYEEIKKQFPEEGWEHYDQKIDQFECWGDGKYQCCFIEKEQLSPRDNLKSTIEKTRRAFHECVATGDDMTVTEKYFDTLQTLVDWFKG